MSSNEDDLDLLLSLQDKVPETPPASPSPLDFDGDDDVVPRRERPDMSVFKDAVQDCLLDQPPNPNPNPKPKPSNKSLGDDPQLDKFSGLRIRDQCLTPAELRESVQDIRFVRLPKKKQRDDSRLMESFIFWLVKIMEFSSVLFGLKVEFRCSVRVMVKELNRVAGLSFDSEEDWLWPLLLWTVKKIEAYARIETLLKSKR
ncbi:hypothetical protein KIW84_074888 [Lathyrus oleraceus]|uniref:MCM10 OB-fold domain-containing protein n=1 Tax=Pisum sativum TaxID=3888 RepID=A0A9D4ZXF4_PEA|nr:hypothetical protein KIW84_074888 [Pisum sativum]